MLTISLPDQGVPRAARLRFVHRKKTVLKQYLDRTYGRQPRPVWADELGEKTEHLHSHTLLGDYGYVDFPRLRKWMVRNGLCDRTQDGRLVPWHLKYELLKAPAQGIRYVAKYLAKSAATVWPRYARTRYVPIAEPRWKGECGPHKRAPYSPSWFADDARPYGERGSPGGTNGGGLNVVVDQMDARVGDPARTRQGVRRQLREAAELMTGWNALARPDCWDCVRLLSAVDAVPTMFTYNRNHHGPPTGRGGGAVS
jgi:hypothetical protein